MAKVSLDELRTRASTVDRAKVEATTEAQIEAYRAEDGYADLSVPETARTVESPRSLRVRLGLTQPEMAAALGIPLGTWRNWEQGRVGIEPAAAALLRVVSHSPEIALAALGAATDPVAVAPSPDAAPAATAGAAHSLHPRIEGGGKSFGGRVATTIVRRSGSTGRFLTVRETTVRSPGFRPKSG